MQYICFALNVLQVIEKQLVYSRTVQLVACRPHVAPGKLTCSSQAPSWGCSPYCSGCCCQSLSGPLLFSSFCCRLPPLVVGVKGTCNQKALSDPCGTAQECQHVATCGMAAVQAVSHVAMACRMWKHWHDTVGLTARKLCQGSMQPMWISGKLAAFMECGWGLVDSLGLQDEKKTTHNNFVQ